MISLGLAYDVGIGGSRLSAAQRQKVALARSLIKKPDLLIVNEAMSSLDADSQAAITLRLREEQAGRSLMLLPSLADVDGDFDQIFNMANGKISSGEGVERVFQTHSPAVSSIEVKRRGAVRRAKLYYLRERSGKSARIKEKLN